MHRLAHGVTQRPWHVAFDVHAPEVGDTLGQQPVREPGKRPEGVWEILLVPTCNLMCCLAHLFTVRSCWRPGRQHWQLEGGAVGGALVG